ncbi:hypothetical protein BDN72DRAFT_779000 [Pluteus cervinus]|uniref:Uncharacterized protein n=1 Tax=Pluteus cervinus TaxID=181527 RepID=A0ACD3A5S8_9AGAR|nr:hypothetical protein BDN72DRAFT_779000 [Pluteus cervinus]
MSNSPCSALNPWDGLVGAVVDGGDYFVTTPNMPIIYMPSLRRRIRSIRIRSDFRYAEDDPVLWPQLHTADYCHLGAIPQKPEHDEDPLRLLWTNLAADDFMPLSGRLLDGIGHPSPTLCAAYARIHDPLADRLRDYQSSKKDKTHEGVLIMGQLLAHAYQRFTSLPLSFIQLRFTWTDVQRLSLELIGILDYMQVHHPRMIGLKDPATKTANTIGAFTYSPIVAQEFQRAGLPIWLIQPFDKLPATRIDSVTEARLPHDFVVSQDASPLLFPAFNTLPDDVEKYGKMGKNHRNLYQPPDPFKLQFGSRKPLPLSGGPSRDHESTPRSYASRSSSNAPNSSNTSYSSNAPRSSNTSHSSNASRSSDTSRSSNASRSSNVYLTHSSCPPTPECWHKALRTPLPTPATTKRVGWLFPDVALFLRVTSDEKRYQYLLSWLRYRQDLIFRLTDPTFTVVPLRSQEWRDFLNFGDTQPTAREDGSTSKGFARRKAMLEILGSCINVSGIQVADGSSNAGLMWNGSPLTRDQVLSPRILRQILMELNELNFRFELAALNRHHRSPEGEDIWNTVENTDILHCLPATTSLLYVSLSEFRYGLAGTNSRSRSPYMMSLARLMSNWDQCPGVILNSHSNLDRLSPEQYTDFENAVASFYVRTFYYHFGRLPAVPLRLG